MTTTHTTYHPGPTLDAIKDDVVRGAIPSGRVLFTADEVAKALGLGRRTIYRHLRTGAIPSQRIGSRRMVPLTVILRLIDAPETGVGHGRSA